MLNDCVIVGRISQLPNTFNNLIEIKSKDMHGEDIHVTIKCSAPMLENIAKYCKLDDVIGSRGSLTEDNGMIIFEAKRISFLSRVNDGPNDINNEEGM